MDNFSIKTGEVSHEDERHLTMTALVDRASRVTRNFARWLDAYGETSWDHQSFFAGRLGGRCAKPSTIATSSQERWRSRR